MSVSDLALPIDCMKKSSSNPAGNTDISAIYKEHHAELKGFISKRVTFREDAEDILQNVFFQLSKIDLVENPIEHVSSWLYAVARNQIIDRSRKKREERLPRPKKASSNDEDFWVDVSTFLSSDDDNPETEYLKSLIWKELELALAELPAEQRSVFELTELENVSFREISESTGIPQNTLLSRKRYAVLHLRERLAGLYADLIGEE